MVAGESRRSALFVDLDNILIGLRKLDPNAAELFGKDPSRWVDALAESDAGGVGRRFLVKNVYLNPKAFGEYRAFFTRSGFRVVDCPALTSQGKNSADIYMVVDILDALSGPMLYDEFVIASGDADFTPVLHRLRAWDRRTTVLTAGSSSAAFRAVCDHVIQPDELARIVLGEEDTSDIDISPSLDVQPSPAVRTAAAAVARTPQGAGVAEVAKAIVDAVRASEWPLVSAAAAHAALTVDRDIKASDWRGAGSFRAFLALYVPEVVYAGSPSPGYVYDPTRHSEADLPADTQRPDLTDTQRQVSRLTDAPAMESALYVAVYEALSAEAPSARFNITTTSKSVRDQTAQAGRPVGRNAITFLIRGLISRGVIGGAETTPLDMAIATADNLIALCNGLQANLTAEQEQEIWDWVAPGASDGELRLPER